MSVIIAPPAAIAAATAQHRDGGTVLDPTVVLRRLTPGNQYAGIVVGTTTEGHSIISLDAALLPLKTDVYLLPGTRVVVRITTTSPALAIELRALSDASATRPAALTPMPPMPPMPQAKNAVAPPASTVAVPKTDEGPQATATLLVPMLWRDAALPPVGAESHPAAAEYWLPPGTQLPVRITIGPLPFHTTTPSQTADIPGAAAANLAAGTRVVAAVYAVLADGRTIVTLPGGDALVLPRVSGLGVGDTLLLTIDGLPLQPTARNGVAFTSPASPWTTLATAWSLLEAEESEATHKIFRAALPRPDAGFGESIKSLLAAAGAGDARVWLGDRVVDWLAGHRPDLLAGIVHDLDEVVDSADGRPDPGGWINISLPLLVGLAIEAIRLRIRQHPASQHQETGNDDQRFVLDVTLDRLGRVQLDTMVRAPAEVGSGIPRKAARLDVVVRSETPLDAAARQDIRALAQTTSEQAGVGVAVGFQAAPPGFVDPPPPSGPAASVIV